MVVEKLSNEKGFQSRRRIRSIKIDPSTPRTSCDTASYMHAHDRLRFLEAMAAAEDTVALVGEKPATAKSPSRIWPSHTDDLHYNAHTI